MAGDHLKHVKRVGIKMDFMKKLRVRGAQPFRHEKAMFCKVSSVPQHA